MKTIGRRDTIDLPALELFNIEAKVDTGAYGCALHCHHIEVIEQDGNKVLTFDLLDPQHPDYEEKVFTFETFGDKVIRNTGGKEEHRYTIVSEAIVFGETHVLEFSLTNRVKMKYPILLGRKFLRKKYIVDVTKKNLSFKLKNKKR